MLSCDDQKILADDSEENDRISCQAKAQQIHVSKTEARIDPELRNQQ